MRDDSKPGAAHRLLAGLPQQFTAVGLEPRYQMIITPKYDAALEQALTEANQPFDVAVYTEQSGRFVHHPWEGLSRVIETPNQYPPQGQPELGFPIIAENNRLMRTVIVRISGSVEDPSMGSGWEDNYVITEDQYIDYLSGLPAEQAVPAQILSKLKKASYLFMGYRIADWRLRVFLHRIWGGSKLGGQKYWAVESKPDELEDDLWTDAGVGLFQSGIGDYLQGLYDFLAAHAEELR